MKHSTILVGLGYEKQVGKSTVARMLVEEFSKTHEVYSLGFADKLKEEVAVIFGTTVEWIEEHKNNPVIRHVLQWYGTDYMRAVNPNHWIDILEQRIFELEQHTAKRVGHSLMVIIQDCRFTNEADWIKKHNGLIFKVIRPSTIKDSLSSHASECELHDYLFNFTIRNEQGLEYLRTECRVISSMIRMRYGIPQTF